MDARITLSTFGLAFAVFCATASGQQLDYYDDGSVMEGETASEECDAEDAGDVAWRLFPQPCDGEGFSFYGWVNAGYMGNASSPGSKFNGPYNAVDRSNEPMLNQFYFVAEKKLPGDDCFGIGGRADFIYGEDFFLAQSVGIENHDDGSSHWNGEYYGIAIPQAYVDIGRNGLSLKVGHFYSIIGYEGLPAVGNFFYSKSLSYQFAGPFTHWGGLAVWAPSDRWEFQGGLTNGWDTFDREPQDNLNALLRVKYTGDYGGWTSFGIVTGDDINNPGALPIANALTNRTRYSWLVSLPVLCNNEYVFHHWLGAQDQGAIGGGTAYWYGIDQYLYHTINDCWKTGLRFEWFRDEDGTRVGLNRPRNLNNVPYVGSFYSLSAGVNWSPTTNLTVRPEIRGDWFDGGQARLPFNDGTNDSQLLLGIDAILLY